MTALEQPDDCDEPAACGALARGDRRCNDCRHDLGPTAVAQPPDEPKGKSMRAGKAAPTNSSTEIHTESVAEVSGTDTPKNTAAE